ncbi:unnamed protein product [Rotaria sp. Silwood2]|nr:unnamed protein product [Rotaria sp. Silwood2]
MNINAFEFLPVDVFFEIFRYLSPIEILQSFSSLNKRFSSIVMYEYMWHIHIGKNRMSLSMFNDFCQNVLRLIGIRVVSLRLTLTNIIGGWSLISSSLKYHKIMSLRRLHLIDIQPHEFDKLLSNHLIKQLHTLLVDLTEDSLFNNQVVEGAYLAKVCSCLPALTICRLPFDFCRRSREQLPKYSAPSLMTLPKLSDTNHLRTLTIGINTSAFLERLLKCIPFIENLSVGIQDEELCNENKFDTQTLAVAVDARFLCRLSRLSLTCMNTISFYRTMALLVSVLGQLRHLSLKLDIDAKLPDSLVISGDTIQRLCIDRLNPLATFTLNIMAIINNDMKDKMILNSYFKAPFANRQRPKVVIHDNFSLNISDHNIFKRTPQMSIEGMDLFLLADELFISIVQKNKYLSSLGDCENSVSSSIPWSLIRKIRINNGAFVSAAELESILRMAYNVDTLKIYDDKGTLPRLILRNTDHLGTRINQQIRSLYMDDFTLTFFNAEHFCTLLVRQLPYLKELRLLICDSYDNYCWIPSHILDGENKSTKRIIKLIHFLVHHLPQLVSLYMNFHYWNSSETPCFPHLIRRQIQEWSLNRPYRLQCSSKRIQIWL